MTFIFKQYGYDTLTKTAWFEYAHSNGQHYREEMQFDAAEGEYDQTVLSRALFLAFTLVGTSYYKCFPTRDISFEAGSLDEWQAGFLNKVYQEGMSQYAFENNLTRGDLAQFVATADGMPAAQLDYSGSGVLSLQSGGKDSLLVAEMLE